MVICVDFDGTCVEDDRPFGDVYTPLVLKPGCLEALRSLKRAGHILVLWSGRNNRARQFLPEFDPLVRVGVDAVVDAPVTRWIFAARWRQMVKFVEEEMPGIFDAVDDGRQGKPTADIFIDDRGVQFGGAGGHTWATIADTYGE